MNNATARTPITSRLYAVIGAVAITLTMLSGIDTLAGHGASLQMSAATQTQQPA